MVKKTKDFLKNLPVRIWYMIAIAIIILSVGISVSLILRGTVSIKFSTKPSIEKSFSNNHKDIKKIK